MNKKSLPANGERFVPEQEGVIRLEHMHRYHLACRIAKDLDVLDIASGEGYGSALLAAVARTVIGVDIDQDAIDHARDTYVHNGLSFLQGQATQIPLPDRAVDLVVSFETIEHLQDHDCMIKEIRRVLKKRGVLMISSPNKSIYSDKSGYKNPFHKHELYTSEFLCLINANFTNVLHYRQKTTGASIIAASSGSAPFINLNSNDAAQGLIEHRYDLIIASDGELPELPNSAYEISDGPLQPEKSELTIIELKNDLEKALKECTRIKDEYADLEPLKNENISLQSKNTEYSKTNALMHNALYQLAEDANKILADKWWRRSRHLRRMSNSIRKLRGRQKKRWPKAFVAEDYLIAPIITSKPDTSRDNPTSLQHSEGMAKDLAELRINHLELCEQLATARRKPMKSLRDLWIHKFLKRFTAGALPLPSRMKARMVKSAAKRHPDRSLPGWRSEPPRHCGVPVNSNTAASARAGRCRPRRPGLPDILLVSHEASWTGAPILVHNLARVYRDRYNVTILCLRGGPLLPAFEDVAVCVRKIAVTDMSCKDGRATLKAFLEEGDFAFAVVNSIESRHVLGMMRELKLPTVSLLHEFASDTLPRTAFPEAIEHADTIIFSTSVTLNNAIDITGIDYSPKIRILPQGKCKVPSKLGDSGPDRLERDRLKALLKPKGYGQEILVVGMGSVVIRKGTDLFIEVARRVIAQPGGEHFRFFWFGEGYNPDEDRAYSVYLQDQLKRSGIDDRVVIQPVTSEIEYVYELADAFLLASRLDPLPNVAIDAMLSGVPMVVFDKASGIPEILCAAGLEKDCVAEYLDTSQMADKLLHVTGKDRDRISAQMQAHARLTFDFAAYAEQIERQAMETTRQFRDRSQAEALIAKDSGFAPDVMYPISLQPDKDRTKAARLYLEHYALGIHPRRPEPGFNQYVYYAHHDASRMQHGDAYADYLSRGRPDGPWITPILQGPVTERSAPNATGLRTALHIHAFYLDGLNDVLLRLKANRSRPKVFVSVRDSGDLLQAKNLLQGYDGESEIRIVPNLGRDIGPFLTEFGPELVRDFEVIGHVHIKKSITLRNKELVERWASFILSNVLGSPKAGAMMDVQLSEFEQVPGLGMTFPADPNILSWNKNRMHAEQLAAKMGLVNLPDAFDFPVGTMFWMRSSALTPFIGLNLGWTDYPSEPLADDGTMLHALERLFGVVPRMNGFETRMTNVPGVNR